MTVSIKEPRELESIYERRFTQDNAAYRRKLWKTLIAGYFQALVPKDAAVLDLGCGYGEFINQIACGKKFGMDLNPRSAEMLESAVQLFSQDCSARWELEDNALDVVFVSNFFEHLPDKHALKLTLLEATRCLRPGGRLIVLGPNIKAVPGAYWDFWDHFLCLTELSMAEAMANNGFEIRKSIARFLPYSTVGRARFPMAWVRWYLRIPVLWRVFGKQFLVIGEKKFVPKTQ